MILHHTQKVAGILQPSHYFWSEAVSKRWKLMAENWRKVTHSQRGLFSRSLSSSWLRDELQVRLMLKWWWCWASCPRMSAEVLGTNCDQCRSMVQCCFTSTDTVRFIRTERPGRPPRLSHSSWTLMLKHCWSIYNAKLSASFKTEGAVRTGEHSYSITCYHACRRNPADRAGLDKALMGDNLE